MSVSSVSGKRYISANIAWGPVSHDKKRRAQASCSVLEMMKRNRKVGDTSLRLQGGLMGFQETTGRKKMKMDFRCSEGTSEDQRVRRGVGLRRCLQGKDERSPISRKSAGLETAANRKRSRRRERPKKMKITPLLCLRPKPPNQEYLLFFWEIGLFLSSGRTKLQLTRGPFRLCLLGLEPSSWSAICVKH